MRIFGQRGGRWRGSIPFAPAADTVGWIDNLHPQHIHHLATKELWRCGENHRFERPGGFRQRWTSAEPENGSPPAALGSYPQQLLRKRRFPHALHSDFVARCWGRWGLGRLVACNVAGGCCGRISHWERRSPGRLGERSVGLPRRAVIVACLLRSTTMSCCRSIDGSFADDSFSKSLQRSITGWQTKLDLYCARHGHS